MECGCCTEIICTKCGKLLEVKLSRHRGEHEYPKGG